MKTKFFLNACLLLCATLSNHFLSAQWNQGTGIQTTLDRIAVGSGTISNNMDFQVGKPSSDAVLQIGANSTATDNFHWRNTAYYGGYGRALMLFNGAFNGTNLMTIKQNGMVGIGVTNPTANLHIKSTSNPYFRIETNQGSLNIGIATCDGCFSGYAKTGDAVIRTLSTGGTGYKNHMIFSTATSFNSGRNIYFASESNILMSVNDNNTVGVGTSYIPAGFRMAVEGKLVCEEVRVQLRTSWPDYVFSKNYKLTDLSEVEQYIQENNHLPGIPSAEEVEKQGITLGEMDAKLLEKIEELTLYVIELEKKVEALENK